MVDTRLYKDRSLEKRIERTEKLLELLKQPGIGWGSKWREGMYRHWSKILAELKEEQKNVERSQEV
jgi:hypothetical protein